MKHTHALLTLALALPLAATAHAQAAPPPTAPPQPPPPMVNAKSYRLIWTIAESEAGKQVSLQHIEVVLTTGGRTTTKVGSKIPVVTGSYSGTANPAAVQSQFQYLDVGLNIDSSLDDTPSGLRLRAKVEQSSVAAQPVTIADVQEPVIRQSVLEGTSILTIGKMITLGSLDVPGSSHHLDISVTLEQLK